MAALFRRALLLAILLPGFAVARDVFVLISGGGTQLSNNYSQYLQARAISAYFDENYPEDSTWVFFGAGNQEGKPQVFSDVRKQTKVDGYAVDGWLPGTLRDNRPAKREIILKALREEILPAVREGGTLYLFVGDHGSLSRGDKPESVINLWTLEPDANSRRGFRANRDELLSVTELRETLAKGLGRGRAVFVMTQCHSGGFHHMAVPRKLTANSGWFTEQSSSGPPAADIIYPDVAGFTATDEQSLAAGCDPSPDPDSWSGYERYVPEKLLGMDLFTLKSNTAALQSFAEAHVEATLVDRTIDKPMATSEQYLERWADLIETDLAGASNLTNEAKRLVEAYRRAVDTGKLEAPATAQQLRERQATFARFVERMVEQNPSLKDLLMTGTRRQLDEVVGTGSGRPGSGQHNHGGGSDELTRQWKEEVRPKWKAAVLAGQATTVPAAALEFEKHLLKAEDDGRELMAGRSSDTMASEVFWESGYQNPATIDAAKAAVNAQWAVRRRQAIKEWAEKSGDNKLEKAAASIAERGPRRLPEQGFPARPLSRKTAAERTLFYRRTLAAWGFLVGADEKSALQRLHDLIELERTPLPKNPGKSG